MEGKGTDNSGVLRFGTASFEKSERLRLLSDFDYVRSSGVKYAGRFLVILIAPARTGALKVGFICSRKFSKKAVVRNRAKRIMKEIFRNSKSGLMECELIMIPRLYLLKSGIREVQDEFIGLMREAGKWKLN
ncbi:MAG TPA: ribonuclease P protein component [Victivallales bacterium]|nr:ribonuclease P protein component [Victivallales bacterium]